MTWLVLKKMLQKRTFPAMLSSKSPDHHVGSGVSGPPAVAVHGVVPAAAAEVIFKGLSFNNVWPIFYPQFLTTHLSLIITWSIVTFHISQKCSILRKAMPKN